MRRPEPRWARLLSACVLGASLFLLGCGGGSDDPPAPVQKATVQGRALDAADGKVLAGATVTLAGVSTTSGADGSFTLEVPGDGPVVLRAEQAGYAAAVTQAPRVPGATTAVDVWLSPVAGTAAITPDGGDVVAVGSPARVSLPPAALADASGAAFTGTATVTLTPIDPASRPNAMPGSYTAIPATGAGTRTIESFGAIHVELKDAATGQPLNLAANKKAVIRIPVATRTGTPPATLPLYHLDEATGIWKEEGTATLVGSGEGAYYEGEVSHFSYWNADREAETIFVNGCVRMANGTVPIGAVAHSEGIDYTGTAMDFATGPEARFRVAIRKSGRALIAAETALEVTNRVEVGPSQTDITLPTCLVLQPGGLPPTISMPPAHESALVGDTVWLSSAVAGRGVSVQWQRNGVDIPGATGTVLVLQNVQLADSGAVFRLVARNAHGTVTSEFATLTVTPRPTAPQSATADAVRLAFRLFDVSSLAMAPGAAANDELALTLAPAAICTSGSVSNATFDGAAITGNQPISANANHRLDVTFNDCITQDGDHYTGRANAEFLYGTSATSLTFDVTSSLTNLRSHEDQLVGNGTFKLLTSALPTNAADSTVTAFTVTPLTGASLEDLATSTKGTFSGGTVSVSVNGGVVVNTFNFNDLAFSVGSDFYVAQGALTFGQAGGSGEVVFTRPGTATVVARLKFVGFEMLIDLGGTTVPF